MRVGRTRKVGEKVISVLRKEKNRGWFVEITEIEGNSFASGFISAEDGEKIAK